MAEDDNGDSGGFDLGRFSGDQSYRNAIRLERHSVILMEIQRRLEEVTTNAEVSEIKRRLDEVASKAEVAEVKRRIGNIERALWGVLASIGLGFVTTAISWIVRGGLAH